MDDPAEHITSGVASVNGCAAERHTPGSRDHDGIIRCAAEQHTPGSCRLSSNKVTGGNKDSAFKRRIMDGIARSHSSVVSAGGCAAEHHTTGCSRSCCIEVVGGRMDDPAERHNSSVVSANKCATKSYASDSYK